MKIKEVSNSEELTNIYGVTKSNILIDFDIFNEDKPKSEIGYLVLPNGTDIYKENAIEAVCLGFDLNDTFNVTYARGDLKSLSVMLETLYNKIEGLPI